MVGVYRTDVENEVGKGIQEVFESCRDNVETRLENFPKYVRRQQLKRFLAMYELFKLALPVKGSVIECGVFRGFGVMTWAKLSTILEPENFTRRIYGFDTFEGFPDVSDEDRSAFANVKRGDLHSGSYNELRRLIELYDHDRFLGHMPKVDLIPGDIRSTIPSFIADHPHLMVSLLFIDCDLYEPTKVALESFLPRMPKGAIVAFDDLDNPLWPGETLAAIDAVGLNKLELRRLDWDPYLAYARVE